MAESTAGGVAPGRRGRAFAGRAWLWAAVVPITLALAGHANLLRNDFAGDAVPWVAANPLLHDVTRPLQIVMSPYRVDVAPGHSPYRPVTSLSHALSWSAGGGDALAYHAFDILLHALATALVCALLGTLGAGPLAAGAGAALFAVHPLHVEAIASIVGRADMLVAGFALLAVLAHLRLGGAARMAAVWVCAALALGAKESGVVVPALILAVSFVRATDLRAFRRATLADGPLWAGLAILFVLYFTLRHAVLGTFTGSDVAPYIGALPPHLRITTAIANWTTYARLLFVPFALSADYGPAVTLPAGLLSLRFWGGLAMLAGSLGLAAAARRRAPLAALGVFWFTIAVIPVTNLLVPGPVWVAERTLYLPSVAVALLAAALAPVLARARVRERRLAGAALLLVLVLFAARSWQRNRTWENSFTLARTLIEERPESFRSAWWLARMVAAEGRFDRAAALFARADSLLPGNPGVIGDYAGTLLANGQPVHAERLLRGLPQGVSADAGIYLVRALVMQRRTDEAAALLDSLRRDFPRDWRLPQLAAQLDSLRAPGHRPVRALPR